MSPSVHVVLYTLELKCGWAIRCALDHRHVLLAWGERATASEHSLHS